jgi:hypothetical protein
VLDETIIPSERFKANFIETLQVFHQLNEAGRRVFRNLFLSDIVGSGPFLNKLRVFTEIPMEVLSTNVAENGENREDCTERRTMRLGLPQSTLISLISPFQPNYTW